MIAMKVLDTLYIPDLDSTYVAFQSSEPLNGRKYIMLKSGEKLKIIGRSTPSAESYKNNILDLGFKGKFPNVKEAFLLDNPK